MSGRIVILAGGISSRMNKPDHSDDGRVVVPAGPEIKVKSMIKLGEEERPFLDYLLFNIVEAGYDDLVIVVGEHDDRIREYYSARDNSPLAISFAVQKIPFGRRKPLGTADALLTALKERPDWKGTRFSICNSDNLYSTNALSTVKSLDYPNALIEYDRDSLGLEDDRTEKFAIMMKDKEQFITSIMEKPSPELINEVKSKHGFVGVSMNLFSFSYEMILPCLQEVPLNPMRDEKELPDAVNIMINRNPKSLFAYPVKEQVPDLTSRSDIKIVSAYINEKYGEGII